MSERRDKTKGRVRKVGSELTPQLLAALAWPGYAETAATFAFLMGVFPGLSEAEVATELDRFWQMYGRQATEYHIARHRDGTRPGLWWTHEGAVLGGRPVLKVPGSTARREQIEADRKVLIDNGILSDEEINEIIQAEDEGRKVIEED